MERHALPVKMPPLAEKNLADFDAAIDGRGEPADRDFHGSKRGPQEPLPNSPSRCRKISWFQPAPSPEAWHCPAYS